MNGKKILILLFIFAFALLANLSYVQASGPNVRIVSIEPESSDFGQPVFFVGEANKTVHDIVKFEWDSNIDDILSNKSEFNTSNLSPGTHSIGFTAEDSAGNKKTATATIEVSSSPFSSINIYPVHTDFGDRINFISNVKSPDGKMDEFRWNSSIDGFLSSHANFSTNDLSIGIHTITFIAQDDRGVWSSPRTETVNVTLQELGRPVQVIPMFATKMNAIRAYNLPPGYLEGGIYCAINAFDCEEANPTKPQVCYRPEGSSPILQFRFNDTGIYEFSISPQPGDPIEYEPRLKVGTVNISLTTPAGHGNPVYFGNWTDLDLVPYGYKTLEARTNKNIQRRVFAGNPYGGVFYRLFIVDDCILTEVMSLTEMGSHMGRRDTFREPLEPYGCSIGEACNYVGEVIAFDRGEVGGVLFRFEYTREPGLISADPKTLEAENVFIGKTSEFSIAIKNTGGAIDNLTAESSKDYIKPILEKTSLRSYENTDLVIVFDIPDNESEGTRSAVINVTQKTEDHVQTISIPISYSITSPEGMISYEPKNHNFGNVIANRTYSKQFTLVNMGTSDIPDLEIDVQDPFKISDLNETLLRANSSLNFTLVLNLTSEIPPGEYDGEITVRWLGQSISIPVSYSFGDFITSIIEVQPDSWNIGHVEPGEISDMVFIVSPFQEEIIGSAINVKSSSPEFFSISPSSFNLSEERTEVEVSFISPSEERDYSEKISFEVIVNGELKEILDIPVTFTIDFNIEELLASAESRLSDARKRVVSLEASGVQNSFLHRNIQQNLSEASHHLDTAENLLDEAEMALVQEEKEIAKNLIDQANSELSQFENILTDVEAFLDESRGVFVEKFGIILVGIFVLIFIAFGLLAFREGWISLDKHPKLKKFILKMKLKFLIPSPKMAPPRRGMPGAGDAQQRPMKELVPAGWSKKQLKKWKEYAQEHPEYAAYMRRKIAEKESMQKERSYQNKRFE